MANVLNLTAELRDGRGRGASRRLRRHGKVPAILYGGGKDPVSVSFDQNDLMHKMDQEAFYSSILTVKVGDRSQAAIVKDVQRHPAKPQVLHIDLQRIVETEKIKMRVPLHFTGEEDCIGVKDQGGVISHIENDVEVACLPRDLPEYLEIDVSELELDNSLRLSDITTPEGVELTTLALGEEYDQPIVAVHRPRSEAELEALEAEVEEEELEAVVEGEEVAEGEEAAEGEPKEEGGEETKSED